MGIRRWWRYRRANAQIDLLADEVNSGRALVADATAYETSRDRTGIPGVVECWDDVFRFKANWELTVETEGWRISKSQIDSVHDSDKPGELVITFREPARFRAIVVTPLMHADKWREMATRN
ncbi:hypothetical protein [Streptomyces cupreus]|uniref:Uncharacterized protein n=1 Tax=Streptomyces cupreus TaxID=2759956 RepID=A0A7X1JD61_9ACTN|nr:hypothetical protein [Streptomyces cupreus]MBC2907622.1 hypothetical protein [Streptomyces cupreus]